MPLTSRVSRRRGVTLAELLVALGLFGIVATLILGILRGQQRFHVGMLEVIDTKRSAQQAVTLLYGDLKAPAATDIYGISDSSIAFRAARGASYVCAIDTGRTLISLPATARAGTAGLTTFLRMPRAGDSVLVFDPGESPSADDDRWRFHVLTADPAGGTCPLRPLGLAASAAEMAGTTIGVAPPISATVIAGSPLRFFVPARYSLYPGAAGWMLGYTACSGGSCSGRQPLSGPYVPFASGGAGGLAFRYLDAQGAVAVDPRRIVRIEIVARARSASVLDVAHVRGQRYRDSLAISVALRNGS